MFKKSTKSSRDSHHKSPGGKMASTPDDAAATAAAAGDIQQQADNNGVVDGPIDFDLDNLFKYFKDCYGEDGSNLDMDKYILGYEEIVKFLNLLGTVFGWVASDVVAKLAIIKGHRENKETGQHYASIQVKLILPAIFEPKL